MRESLITNSDPVFLTRHTRRACLKKITPDFDEESTNPGRASTINVIRERQQGHLGLPKLPQQSTATSSRPDISRLGSHVSADTGMTTTDTSSPHTRRQEGGPWFTDLSRQYAPPLQSSVQSTPRISSHSFLPRIRVDNTTEQPQAQRPLDEWTRFQKSYSTSSLPLTPGQPHAALVDSDNSPEFARVKPEPDADLSMPPLKLGWTYVTHHPHTFVPFVQSLSVSLRSSEFLP